ncbi:Oxygen-dependent choline dehydrogenase [Lachnellula willkommii]|uniref:Oxygen-dependent choline dehydrogenase n=1 Tax=Lachnellula willkommii TaxID=215461 RepID=A0A559M243_9HELO|nr:Oxygen-dependent choline dehydrogenase [Lachnellula willkommii]
MSQQESSMEEVYDYIICGGGTAGCVIAGRLAEKPGLSILLVEAGDTDKAYPATAIPAAVSQILGTEADWNIKSEPCRELNDRQLHLARGKFLGGCSGCNGALVIRGNRQDYDNWGLEGWSGDEVFQYMSKAESFRNNSWFDAEKAAHGYDGPLITSPHNPAPISSLVLKSYQSMGMPLIPDMFSAGKSAHGCGHVVRTINQGTRTLATDYLTNSLGQAGISVKTKSYIDRINLETNGAGELQANGVILQDTAGHKTFVKARKEVIISAGTYGSPCILLRSGIGAKEEVEKLGINSQVDLPGVGKNLIDHLVLLSFYEVSEPATTNDHLIWHTGGKEKSLAQYKTNKTGFFSQFPFGTFAFARLDDKLANSTQWQNATHSEGRDPMGLLPTQPHVEFWNTECYSHKYTLKDFPDDDKYAFAMATELFAPRSRGEVSIKSTDPTENPIVNHNYLKDPLDMLMFSEACRTANEIATQGEGTKDIVIGSWPRTNKHHTFTTREEWESVIRSNADTCYHPAGTCKMGKVNDPMAVLDEKLRVRGVSRLRVADASSMPSLIGGHPQMPVYGIGEKAADLIKAEN